MVAGELPGGHRDAVAGRRVIKGWHGWAAFLNLWPSAFFSRLLSGFRVTTYSIASVVEVGIADGLVGRRRGEDLRPEGWTSNLHSSLLISTLCPLAFGEIRDSQTASSEFAIQFEPDTNVVYDIEGISIGVFWDLKAIVSFEMYFAL
jgi:hypothetical protein